MATEKKYVILPQIAVMKNNTKLIEALDELEEAHYGDQSEPYGCIHTKYSRILLRLKDYQNKENPTDVAFKVEPELITYFLECRHVIAAAPYESMKVNAGTRYDDGTVRVVKLKIQRDKKLRSPWKITVENGRGTISGKEGGKTEAKNYKVLESAPEDGSVTFFMKDQEYFLFMKRIQRFVDVWEIAYGCNIIRKGRELEAERIAAYKASKQGEGKTDSEAA